MKTTEHIEQWRITKHQDPRFDTTIADGMNGCFQIPYREDERIQFMVIVSDGDPDANIHWEHVSARARSRNAAGKWHERVPNWKEMCFLKELFWKDDEVAVQFHPKKANYVNIHPNVLHLWRFIGGDFPTPPEICV